MHASTLMTLAARAPLQASEVIFGDVWLFRAPRNTESAEMLAMLGQPDGHGFELIVSNWDSPEACARDLAKALNVSAESLLASPSEGRSEISEEAEEGASESQAASSMGEFGEDAIAWSAAVSAMQSLPEQVVLLVRCHEAPHAMGGSTRGQQQDVRCRDLGHALLGRLVGCVANAHIAAQVLHARRGNVSVVLSGWTEDKIEADWSDDDPDELCIASLQ